MFIAKYDETKPFVPLSIAVIAVSDTRTLETDTSAASLKQMLEADGHNCASRTIVVDEIEAIRAAVQALAANAAIDVIITTGGTGFSGRDVTPEALEPLFDKRMDGFSVLFHQFSAAKIGTATLQSRATAGLIDTTLVFCLPGSRGACKDAWQGVLRMQLDSRHRPCNFVEIMPRMSER